MGFLWSVSLLCNVTNSVYKKGAFLSVGMVTRKELLGAFLGDVIVTPPEVVRGGRVNDDGGFEIRI